MKYFEIVTKFRYLAKTAEYRNFIHEDSKRNARFGTLRETLLSIQVLWDVMPCRIVHA